MLADAALKQLKPKGKPYKAANRDGMYAHVSSSGTVTFRYDYRLNGRRETILLGRYGKVGISLAVAPGEIPRRSAIGIRGAFNPPAFRRVAGTHTSSSS